MPNPVDSAARERAIEAARKILGIETLAERGSDRLDFHDIGVVTLRRVLELAFDAGCESAKSAAPELLAALREFMDVWNSGDSTKSNKRAQARRAAMWDAANASVAKAEGSKPYGGFDADE